jgi:uncharacterized protein (DUF362 family)
MNRRQFIAGGAALSAGLTTGLIRPGRSLAAGPEVAVVRGGPAEAVRAAVDLMGGMGRFVQKNDKVVIKPNMSFPTGPERASNTHPVVVSTLAAMCRDAGAAKVLVLDNPLSRAERCLEASGIQAACRPLGDDMVHMATNRSLYKEVAVPGGLALEEALVQRDVIDADALIAAPVAKSHSGAGVSLSMKGMMGLVYDRGKMHYRGLSTAIVDLASLLTPDLVVIDATRVLSSGGPYGPGDVIDGGRVIASTDMVAADAMTVASFDWYGSPKRPEQVPHIRKAHQRMLGRMDVENLVVKEVTL